MRKIWSGTGRRVSAALVLAVMAVTAGGASAQQASSAVRSACAEDAKTLCSGVQPGGGRIAACFRQNRDKLSPGCKQALITAKEARKPPSGG